MNSTAEQGFALRCSTTGEILETLTNTTPLPLHPGAHLSGPIAPRDRGKLIGFLVRVEAEGSAFGLEVHFHTDGHQRLIQLSGVKEGDSVALLGSSGSSWLYDELMAINNSQVNLFRNFFRGMVRESLKNGGSQDQVYDEIAHLNNEVINTQRTVMKKNAEIERALAKAKESNEALGQFAAAVSHDLRNPLASIIYFFEMKKGEIREKCAPETAELAETVQGIARRMEKMVRDLLRFSQLTTKEYPIEDVDLNEMGLTIRKNLKALIEESGGMLTVHPLPQVKGNGVQLTRLMQNLVQNAFIHRGDRPPEVTISSSDNGEGPVISVTDNGPGIEPKNRKAIFEIFRQLDPEKGKGTGIGLAECRKIVEQHGGTIWVESEFGKGTTFLFSLPRKN